MSKHTPGPWELHGILIAKFGEHHAMICQLSEPRASTELRHEELRIGSPHHAEAYANARLIATAPELLAACKDTFDVLTEPGVMDVDEWKAWKRRAEDTARTAIAKAEGKS